MRFRHDFSLTGLEPISNPDVAIKSGTIYFNRAYSLLTWQLPYTCSRIFSLHLIKESDPACNPEWRNDLILWGQRMLFLCIDPTAVLFGSSWLGICDPQCNPCKPLLYSINEKLYNSIGFRKFIHPKLITYKLQGQLTTVALQYGQ